MCKDFILGLYLVSKVIAHTIHDLLDASTTIKDLFYYTYSSVYYYEIQTKD